MSDRRSFTLRRSWSGLALLVVLALAGGCSQRSECEITLHEVASFGSSSTSSLEWKDEAIVAFLPGGTRLLTYHRNLFLRVRALPSGHLLLTLGEQYRGYPYTGRPEIAFTADGKRLVVRHREAPVRVWDLESGQQLAEFDAYGPLAISDDGSRVACGSTVYDVASGKIVTQLSDAELPEPTREAGFSPDNAKVAVAACGAVYVWDMKSGELVLKVIVDADEYPQFIISVSGRWIMAFSADDVDEYHFIDLDTGKTLCRIKRPGPGWFGWAIVLPGARQVVMQFAADKPSGFFRFRSPIRSYHSLCVYDLATGDLLGRTHLSDDSCLDELSADGRLVGTMTYGRPYSVRGIPCMTLVGPYRIWKVEYKFLPQESNAESGGDTAPESDSLSGP